DMTSSGVPPSSMNHSCRRRASIGRRTASSSQLPKSGFASTLRRNGPDHARAGSNIMGWVITKETKPEGRHKLARYCKTADAGEPSVQRRAAYTTRPAQMAGSLRAGLLHRPGDDLSWRTLLVPPQYRPLARADTGKNLRHAGRSGATGRNRSRLAGAPSAPACA